MTNKPECGIIQLERDKEEIKMKAYRVYWETVEDNWDGWGTHRGKDEAKYFLNKKDAEAFLETGKYYIKEYRVWQKYEDNKFSDYYGTVNEHLFEKYKKNGDKVEIVEREYNKYTLEEIEIKE